MHAHTSPEEPLARNACQTLTKNRDKSANGPKVRGTHGPNKKGAIRRFDSYSVHHFLWRVRLEVQDAYIPESTKATLNVLGIAG